MNSSLVTQALKLHGKNLWSVFEDLRNQQQSTDRSNPANNKGDQDVSAKPAQGFISQEQQRKKRLCQFIAKKADIIFRSLETVEFDFRADKEVEEFCAIMPPLETFMGVPGSERRKHFFDTITKGDVLLGHITSKQEKGFIITVLCMDAGKRREIHDLDIKSFCPLNQIPPLAVHESLFGSYQLKDLVRGVVISVSQEQEKIVLSMKNELLPPHLQDAYKLGLISEEEIPAHHRRTIQLQGKSYMDIMKRTRAFNNPTTASHLCVALGLPHSQYASLTKELSCADYPDEEYAAALRKAQSAKWAYRSVKDGVAYFKSGNHTEAFQCLNKALQIDPTNTEALVARGALFANNDNYRKALEDFEMALDVNPSHSNARKYMSETLVELGKCYERRGEIEGAAKTYRKAVQVNPSNMDAKQFLAEIEARERRKEKEVLKKRSQDPLLSHSFETRDKLKQLLKEDQEKQKKRSKYSSSSSSSSNGDSSSDSSSSTSSSRSSHSAKGRHGKRHHKSHSSSSKTKNPGKQDFSKGKSLNEKSYEEVKKDKCPKSNEHWSPVEPKPKISPPARRATSSESAMSEDRVVREAQNAPARKPSPKVFFVMNKKKDLPLSKIYGRSSLIDPDSPNEETLPPSKNNTNTSHPSNVKMVKGGETDKNFTPFEAKGRSLATGLPSKTSTRHDNSKDRSYSPRRSYSRSRSRSRERDRYRSRSRSRSSDRSYSRSPSRRHRSRHRYHDSPSPRYRSRSRRHESHDRYSESRRSHSPPRHSYSSRSPYLGRSHGSRSRRCARSRRAKKIVGYNRQEDVGIISRAPDLEYMKKLKAEKASQHSSGEKPLLSAKMTKAVIIQNLTDTGSAATGLQAAKLAAQRINETLNKCTDNETV